MKKTLWLSLIATLGLYADTIELDTILVETSGITEVVKDVSGEDIKSADLADALAKQSPSVSLVRRSGIANDIRIRGQKKDNINVSIDGAKVHGACPNRMDPPVSHVLTNNIDYIEINEGPFSVEDFGVLSADVKIHTLKPNKEFKGEINLGMGSFGYQKTALSLSAGTDTMRFLFSASSETGGQYKDGNGNDFVGQIADNIANGLVSPMAQYQDKYKGMDAFTKKTFMAKMFWNMSDTEEVRLSYTANRSDNVLYPSSKMDAMYDDSDIYNIEYISRDLGEYSKELSLQAYHSEVDHPMSTKYRQIGAINYITHALTTQTQGAKIKNTFDWENHSINLGVDYSLRNWDGGYLKNDKPFPEAKFHSIWDVDTENIALFIEDKMTYNNFSIDWGMRYDMTEIDSANPKQNGNEFDILNAYILAKYQESDTMEYFIGAGKSSRVPDAKELYWVGSKGNIIGTPDLESTINYELDVGFKKSFENGSLKGKVFYSYLENYIAYNAFNTNVSGASVNAYDNVDARLYGFDVSGSYIATESIYFDYSMAYQKGEKVHALQGQVGKSLADIAPLKLNTAVNYDYDDTLNLRLELIASDSWDEIDYENGEQKLDAYRVLNFKASKYFSKGFELSIGVDNVLDETYSVSNTYKDLVLLTTENNEVMLMNEPGRYFYANLKYKF